VFIIGGESKRGAPGSDNERMIEVVAPNVNYLIVTKDGNKDRRFTDIAGKKNIPLTEVDYALDVVDILKKVLNRAGRWQLTADQELRYKAYRLRNKIDE